MDEVYVVYYDEAYQGFGERGPEQRRIEGVYYTVEKARAKVRDLAKLKHITYADFDVYEVF
jgi:hypothetical protein